MKADAEHQQHDADLGQLARDRDIGNEARRRRADQHASEHVAGKRRQACSRSEESEHERETERRSERGDERRAVAHLDQRGARRLVS